ncbi:MULTISPECIES: tyrosine-type recombinase/integrase [unclassified Streptomyces]|uniref:tyrosine-type recombinase/integrase n=1 Tax=unclassified Streptomyces TaxID=2593676 RepID=UPI00380BBF80
MPRQIGQLKPHVLRHFAPSDLYRNGMDVVAIQEILGHEWLNTTVIYVNLRELHQAGEKSQVAWSQRETEALRGLYELAF